jgi:hypothetical protein
MALLHGNNFTGAMENLDTFFQALYKSLFENSVETLKDPSEYTLFIIGTFTSWY